MTDSLDLLVDLAERLAVLEVDGGLDRATAEKQAIGELLDRLYQHRRPPAGIIGELIAASQRRYMPEVDKLLQEVGLSGRAPLWGFGCVVLDGHEVYRPALDEEAEGELAVIVPSAGEGIDDLIAFGLRSRRHMTRLGIAAVVGEQSIDQAHETGSPLLVFDNALTWLLGHTLGVVLIDWRRAIPLLEGVKVLACSRTLAPKLYQATRRSWPRPTVLLPQSREVRHAAA